MPTYAPPHPPPALQPEGRQPTDPTAERRARRAAWLRTLHQWHWISSAICLFGMLLFSVTGITLNHAGAIKSTPSIVNQQAELSSVLLDTLRTRALQTAQAGDDAPLPAELRTWIRREMGVSLRGLPAEWSEDEIYLPLPRPGGDAWLNIDLHSGLVEYEHTDRGWIAWANDLHKGRNTGPAWSGFIDLFAGACVVFSLTGLLILQAHAANRPMVWPTVGLGVVIPVLLALLFIH